MKTKNNSKKILTIQKQIDIDAHFKYRCPSSDCGYEHWISLKQAQTINYKIVCDCGNVFKPKRIKKITITYRNTQNKKKSSISEESKEMIDRPKALIEEIPKILLNQCTKTLLGYGFTNEESEKMISETFRNTQIRDCSLLIKTALQNLGANKNG